MRPWRFVAAVGWVLAVLTLGVFTRLDPDFNPCKTATLHKPTTRLTETTIDKKGETTKETKTAASRETTTTCEPPSAGELTLLMLPVLIFLWPALKGFNIGGFGMDLREMQRQVVERAQEQVVRVVVEHDLGRMTEEALGQIARGDLQDLPEE